MKSEPRTPAFTPDRPHYLSTTHHQPTNRRPVHHLIPHRRHRRQHCTPRPACLPACRTQVCLMLHTHSRPVQICQSRKACLFGALLLLFALPCSDGCARCAPLARLRVHAMLLLVRTQSVLDSSVYTTPLACLFVPVVLLFLVRYVAIAIHRRARHRRGGCVCA